MFFDDGDEDEPLVPARHTLFRGQKPVQEWLKELERVKEDALAHPSKPRLTLQDVADRAMDSSFRGRLVPTSPRSIDACLRLGIDPASLRHIPLEAYAKWERDPELARLAYDSEESLRQTRVKNLLEERARLEEQGLSGQRRAKGPSQPGSPGPGGGALGQGVGQDATMDMVEREAKRLEVLRRRQERELQQMVAHEVARREQEQKAKAKIEALERRTEEQRKAREAAAEEWSRQQRDRALAKKQEEAEKERQDREQEAARHAREAAAAAAEEEEAFKRRQMGYQKELERLAKANAARAETDRILAEQEAAIAARREAIQQREAQREAAKAALIEERAAANALQQRLAEARIATTLESNRQKMEEKIKAAQDRWEAAEARSRALEAARQAEDEEKRRRDREKEEQRRATYEDARRQEAERVAEVLRRAADKDADLAALAREREAEAARKALERRLQLKHKAEAVEQMKRRDAFERAKALKRIEEETSHAQALLAQRSALQQQRRQANLDLSVQRQRVAESMSKLLSSGGWERALAQGLDVSSLLRK
ncbi:FAP56 [Auxenochlorella protothecoides x Auxenochlorella symbiontica]